jgi:multidrug efflux pump subunit AcrA (membrane-fusion protein)
MILIAVLYIISVPWYREEEAPLRLWLGLPDWVAVALLCYVGVALVNAVAWSVAEIPDAVEASGRVGASDEPGAER